MEHEHDGDGTTPGGAPVVTTTRVREPYPGTAPGTRAPDGTYRPGVFTQRRPGYLPRRDGRRDNDGAGWLLGLLILLLLGALLWWFLSQGEDSTIDEPGTAGVSTQTGATGATGTTGAGTGGGAGTEGGGGTATDGGTATGGQTGQITTTDGRDLLAEVGASGNVSSGNAASAASAFENDTVHGDGLEVLAVVGDEVFWVGASDARVLVALTPNGESVIDVDVGDVVAFSGVVRRVPNDAEGSFGIGEGEGLGELQEQGLYIEALTAREVSSSG
jgi:hypothetical protein